MFFRSFPSDGRLQQAALERFMPHEAASGQQPRQGSEAQSGTCLKWSYRRDLRSTERWQLSHVTHSTAASRWMLSVLCSTRYFYMNCTEVHPETMAVGIKRRIYKKDWPTDLLTKYKTFCFLASRRWNELPLTVWTAESLASFKQRHTYLFTKQFNEHHLKQLTVLLQY